MIAVIVAAGMSSRMGEPKQLLNINGQTFIRRIAGTFNSAGVKRLIAVTGYAGELVENELKGSGAEFVRNEDYANTDMFASVRLGLIAAKKHGEDVLFTTCDTPLFSVQTVHKVTAEAAAAKSGIVVPCYSGIPGHPVFIGRADIDGVTCYTGGEGLRGAVKALGAVFLELPDKGIAAGANTQSEYYQLLLLEKEIRSNM